MLLNTLLGDLGLYTQRTYQEQESLSYESTDLVQNT